MTKRELRDIAKDVIAEAIGMAYYKITDDCSLYNLNEDDKNLVLEYINKYGVSACKAIKKNYVTF